MGVTLRHYLFLLVIAFAVTYLVMPLVKKLAVKWDAIDYPEARRINKVPIPRLGGIAICVGVFVAVAVELIGEKAFGWYGLSTSTGSLQVDYRVLFVGLLIVAGVGTCDDVKSLRPRTKFLGQIVGASVIAASGVLLSSIANPVSPGIIHFGILAYPITVFYLVAFMNVINLVDGLDGLAGGIVSIFAFTLFVIAFGGGRIETALVSIVLLGATLAFLRFNYSPASVFMGDSGSLFLGAMIGVVSLLGVMRTPAVIMLAVPLVIAAIPIADTFFAIVRRLIRHQPIQQADTGHLHHVLMNEVHDTKKAVAIIHLWTAVLAIGAYLMSSTHGIGAMLVFAVLVAISFLILWRLKIIGSVLTHHYEARGRKAKDENGSANGEE